MVGLEFTSQALLNERVTIVTEAFLFDFFQHLTGKSVEQQALRLQFINASRLKIEECLFVQLTYCTAVRTLYVIGPNLQLRFGIDNRIFGEENIVVLLKGVGLLSVLTDKDLPIKHSYALIGKNNLVQLVGFSVGNGVIHVGVIVHVGFAIDQVDSVHVSFGIASYQIQVEIISYHFAGKGNVDRLEPCVSLNIGFDVTYLDHVFSFVLQSVKVDIGIYAAFHFYDPVYEVAGLAQADTLVDEGHFGEISYFDPKIGRAS